MNSPVAKKSTYPPWQKSQFGRPTNYKPEYCTELEEYFNVPTTIPKTKTIKTDKGTKTITEDVASELPTMEGFAHKIGTTLKTLLDWVDVYPEFCDTYRRMQQYQKHLLIVNGTLGLYNSNMSIFVAKNLTDMRDRTEVEHTASPGLQAISEGMQSLFERIMQPDKPMLTATLDEPEMGTAEGDKL